MTSTTRRSRKSRGASATPPTQIDAPVVGGNLSRGPSLSIATTLLGKCERAVERSGARAGDGVWMAGRVGLAAAGMKALERGLADGAWVAAAVEAWRRPRALVTEGARMAGVAHAAIDVSDGLARDAGHMAEASGVALVLDEALLLADEELAAAARALDQRAIDLALYGGEDYALVAASRYANPRLSANRRSASRERPRAPRRERGNGD